MSFPFGGVFFIFTRRDDTRGGTRPSGQINGRKPASLQLSSRNETWILFSGCLIAILTSDPSALTVCGGFWSDSGRRRRRCCFFSRFQLNSSSNLLHFNLNSVCVQPCLASGGPSGPTTTLVIRLLCVNDNTVLTRFDTVLVTIMLGNRVQFTSKFTHYSVCMCACVSVRERMCVCWQRKSVCFVIKWNVLKTRS